MISNNQLKAKQANKHIEVVAISKKSPETEDSSYEEIRFNFNLTSAIHKKRTLLTSIVEREKAHDQNFIRPERKIFKKCKP